MRRRWADEVEQITGIQVHLSQHTGILMIPHLPTHDLARILEAFAEAAGSVDDRLFTWSPARLWHELHV